MATRRNTDEKQPRQFEEKTEVTTVEQTYSLLRRNFLSVRNKRYSRGDFLEINESRTEKANDITEIVYYWKYKNNCALGNAKSLPSKFLSPRIKSLQDEKLNNKQRTKWTSTQTWKQWSNTSRKCKQLHGFSKSVNDTHSKKTKQQKNGLSCSHEGNTDYINTLCD